MTISNVEVMVYDYPTNQPEADGTIAWDATTVVVVRLSDGDHRGLGWTYGAAAARGVIVDLLAPHLSGADTNEIPRIAEDMARACRNVGRPGIAACAISAVDIALWDLRARQLELPLTELFGWRRDDVPVYGSGGFTTYDDATLTKQLSLWVDEWQIPRVKIKIAESWGERTDRDMSRVVLARETIGDADLFVDANGGYSVKQAIQLGQFVRDEADVQWFEEPVSSDDLTGLRHVRDHFDGEVAAGEYGYTLDYFARMIGARAVDCVQADVTRCGGYSVWLKVAALAEANHLDLSAHCAPNLHAPAAAAINNLRHIEYFHDHHRIETTLFEGSLSPHGGVMRPDRSRPGHGLELRDDVAAAFRTS
ncbi:MAG: enolase C-terminal domain-like protein [Acidimicrobiales bacterium]